VIRDDAEQEKLWPPVEAAIGTSPKARFRALKPRLAAPPTTDFLVALGKMAGNEEAPRQDIRRSSPRPSRWSTRSARSRSAASGFLGMIDVPGGQPSGQLWLFEEKRADRSTSINWLLRPADAPRIVADRARLVGSKVAGFIVPRAVGLLASSVEAEMRAFWVF